MTTFNKAYAGLRMHTSMTILPFEGVKGLSLYRKQKENAKELMLRNLKFGKEFCDVAKEIFSNPVRAISENVSIYRGMREVYKDENKRKEVVEDIKKVSEVIDTILERGSPSLEKVIYSIDVLTKILEESEKRLEEKKACCERVILGSSYIDYKSSLNKYLTLVNK